MTTKRELKITIGNNGQAANLLGHRDENLRLLEQSLQAGIVARGDEVILTGTNEEVEKARRVFEHLLTLAKAGVTITVSSINYAVNMVAHENENIAEKLTETIYVTPRGKQIKAKTLGQYQYIQSIRQNGIVFGIGPAGTGKTYLAVVMAVLALKNKEVTRIILARPAVEAGEKLGFLPGDLQDKVNPYLRPIYDSLYDVLGMEAAQKFMERNTIEVAPLAYMRGRTLDDAFIILDEAQNTTPQQMKMFLTRIGFGSRAVVTGDITQVDLPQGQYSGLMQVQKILRDIPGIGFCYLTQSDVVRHPLVQKIINAYEENQM
ncbi:PhoH family protein [Candidatus Formimonas warabiya]|uniref:PhoH-like protein n=1 Tax=Formimonas warabiya TaxID=1761012 RepID=A0A3G1KXX6_FORW1|nr:PhoH family protein [Candidatus Formimonas warabiya]ATW27316.1 phosphate starvation-inducible protein PhoH [Candidatus Formimonas warabiya]